MQALCTKVLDFPSRQAKVIFGNAAGQVVGCGPGVLDGQVDLGHPNNTDTECLCLFGSLSRALVLTQAVIKLHRSAAVLATQPRTCATPVVSKDENVPLQLYLTQI